MSIAGFMHLISDAYEGTFFRQFKKQRFWMAYMDMDRKWRIALSALVFLVNFSIVASRLNIGVVINMIGAITMPMTIYVFPGYLYYKF
jgi:hypothetical protein